MKNGILLINKEKNMTSRDVVNEVCKKLNTKHIGHMGTLDPLATGVLALGINEGCKVIDLLTNESKEYQAEVIVGIKTDTLDSTGKILESYNIENLTSDKIIEALNKYIGKYNQEVPKYSAIHVDGKRLYEYARNNEEVILPKREVEIFTLEYLNDLHTEEGYYHFSFKTHVSKGTYIRSLIRDIGNTLGYPCIMNNLIRLRQGNFKLEECTYLNDVSEDKIISIEESLSNMTKIYIDLETSKKVQNGMVLKLDNKNDEDYLLVFNDELGFLAIYEKYDKEPDKMKPYRVFRR